MSQAAENSAAATAPTDTNTTATTTTAAAAAADGAPPAPPAAAPDAKPKSPGTATATTTTEAPGAAAAAAAPATTGAAETEKKVLGEYRGCTWPGRAAPLLLSSSPAPPHPAAAPRLRSVSQERGWAGLPARSPRGAALRPLPGRLPRAPEDSIPSSPERG